MVLVNGKKISVYELDNINTFTNRIADLYDTLGDYLEFSEILTPEYIKDKKKSIIVYDVLKDIKKSAEENGSILNLLDNVFLKLGKKFNVKDRVIPLWFYWNKILNEKFKVLSYIVLDKVFKDILDSKIGIQYFTIKNIWDERVKVYNKVNERIKKNKNDVKKNVNMFKSFKKIEAVVYTDFIIQSIKFINYLDIKDISLLELFNMCVTTTHVPFLTTNNYYKILSDFVPLDEWVNSSNEYITMKVYYKEIFDVNNLYNYSDTLVKIDPVSNEIYTEIEMNVLKGNIFKDDYVLRSLKVFNGIDINIRETKESNISGIFYFPFLTLDKYVFSDMVMNNEIFKMFINIDEHEKTTKRKSNIYIHFNHNSTGYITATVTHKTMLKYDITLLGLDQDIFPVGGNYIRVKVTKAKDEKSVKIFQKILGKLLTIYDSEYNEIRDFYLKYIKNFGVIEEQEKEDIKINDVKSIAPEIFVSNYTTYCPLARMPTIISKTEAEEKGKNAIKFPRDKSDDKNIIQYKYDGNNQQYYTCNNDKDKYIGLSKNKLKNSENFPYIPCCFKNEQDKKPNYLHYYKNIEPSTIIKGKQDIIRTNKILTHTQFGSLPLNIDNLFTFIYANQDYEYVRKGVYRDENSFLSCVMEALDSVTNILSITDKDEREVFLIDKRKEFMNNKSLISLCRQELYDLNSDEIKNIIGDPNKYFDPKLFIHLVEEYFKCNIFLFTKKSALSEGELVLPRHLQTYYKTKNNYPCIYIYEHYGTYTDSSPLDGQRHVYPQCELIVKYNITKNEQIRDLFSYKDSSNLIVVFSKINESWALNNKIIDIYMPLTPKIKILSQYIDSYGKTRILNIKFNKNKYSLIISPIQPIKVKENTNKKIYRVSMDIALQLLEELKIKITSQNIINNKTYEINGIIGNVTTSIPIEEGIEVVTLPNIKHVNEGLSMSLNNISYLDQYNKNKKIARYLTEYTLWCFSNYLKNNKKDISDKNIEIFARTYFKINPDFKYGYVSKTFSYNNSLMENNILIVNNIETIKRLVYTLRLNIQRNYASVIDYYKKTLMKHYYIDITDFTEYPSQIILYGDESIYNWIYENNNKYYLYDYIKIGYNYPYFFSNKLIDNNIYIAQNTLSIEKASAIAIAWIDKGYNIGLQTSEEISINKIPSFILYSYKNSNNISKHNIKNVKSNYIIKIIGYKIENKSYYTVLLQL